MTVGELRFDGKVVLVTGAGRGAGRSHALMLAAAGAKVVVNDPGVAIDGSGFSSGPADEVVQEIRVAGGEAIANYDSVADEAGAAAMIQSAIDHFGRLDCVINKAGIAKPERFEIHTADEFRRMIDVHYLGTVYVCHAAWNHFMQNGGGRIVNTVSEGAMGTLPMQSAYGGAKGAVIGLTLALAAEGPKYGISVNGFGPRVASRMSTPEVLGHVHEQPPERFAPLGGMFKPELCSPAAIYLAHESCQLNGVMLVAGGGQVMRMGFWQNKGMTSPDLSAAMIAEHIDDVIDMSKAAEVKVGMIGQG
jgi:NAD(P)-dependent dehydrogenase (short-subunit alcohol dehydrogenase family)